MLLNEKFTDESSSLTEIMFNNLDGKIPPYMIPNAYKVVKEFPMNKSHKIDKLKLAEMYKKGEL